MVRTLLLIAIGCCAAYPWSRLKSFSRHEFETRSLPRSLAATRRGFAFYVADPLSSIHEFTLT
jgi:hypothetical protein